MSDTALPTKSFTTTPSSGANDALRELIAAMPVVIFANAVRAAWALRTGRRASVPAAAR